MFADWLKRYGPERIILGADVLDGKIAINGWLEHTERDIFDFIAFYKAKGISQVLCTDISKDGALSGTSIELYRKIMKRFPDLNLIATGVLSSADDIITHEKASIKAVV